MLCCNYYEFSTSVMYIIYFLTFSSFNKKWFKIQNFLNSFQFVYLSRPRYLYNVYYHIIKIVFRQHIIEENLYIHHGRSAQNLKCTKHCINNVFILVVDD